MATRTIRFDPAKKKEEYNIIVQCDANEQDELVWICPGDADSLVVTLENKAGHQPAIGGPTLKDKILDKVKIKDIKEQKKLGAFKYDISVTYPGGTLSFDPTVKILP